MTTKEMTLPPDVAARIDARVANGEADSPEEVVRAALAALDAEDARKLEAVRAKVARSLADQRPSIPAEEVFAKIDALIESLEKK